MTTSDVGLEINTNQLCSIREKYQASDVVLEKYQPLM